MDAEQSDIADALAVVSIGYLIHRGETDGGPGIIRCNGNQIQLRLIGGREVLIHPHPMSVDGLMQPLIGGMLRHSDTSFEDGTHRATPAQQAPYLVDASDTHPGRVQA